MTTTAQSLDAIIVPVKTVDGDVAVDQEVFGHLLNGKKYVLKATCMGCYLYL
jgi:hypothetical protein